MARGRKGKQEKHIKRMINSKKPKEPIFFDILPESLDKLQNVIKISLKKKNIIIFYCSLADNLPGTELCELPEVRELFKRACFEYGLLGYLEWQKSYYPKTEDTISTLIGITCGTIVKTNGVEFEAEIDKKELFALYEKSIEKFFQLYEVKKN